MKYFKISIFLFFLSLFSCSSCNREKGKKESNNKSLQTTNYELRTKINRYELALFKLNHKDLANSLASIHKQYRFFLGDNYNDKANIKQMSEYLNEPLIRDIYNDCVKVYPDMADIEKQFGSAFSNLKKLYPELKVPKLYTYVSGLDFDNPIRFADSVIVISLDMYLGSNYAPYLKMGIPDYKRLRCKKEFIVSDCMKSLAESCLPKPENMQTMLDIMLQRGKMLYFTKAVIPDLPDEINIGYSKLQLDWCRKNEANMWAFLINNKLLFANDNSTITKFLGDGPFTAAFNRESPARVGEWLGLQIVNSYMVNNKNINLKALMTEPDAQQILNRSKYKPQKS